VTAGLSASLALGLAMPFAFLSSISWELWGRPADPPRFTGYSVRPGWKIDPIALLDQDLRRDRLTWAVTMVHDRLVGELTGHYGMTPDQILGSVFPTRDARPPVIDRACRAVLALEDTYRLAFLAEDPNRKDVWSEWRRPVWRSEARRRFQEELDEVVTIWPYLESGR
jgi:hypothetical protein